MSVLTVEVNPSVLFIAVFKAVAIALTLAAFEIATETDVYPSKLGSAPLPC